MCPQESKIIAEPAEISPEVEREKQDTASTILILSLKDNVLHHMANCEESNSCWNSWIIIFEPHNGARVLRAFEQVEHHEAYGGHNKWRLQQKDQRACYSTLKCWWRCSRQASCANYTWSTPEELRPFCPSSALSRWAATFQQTPRKTAPRRCQKRRRATTSPSIVNHQGKATFWNILQRPSVESWTK